MVEIGQLSGKLGCFPNIMLTNNISSGKLINAEDSSILLLDLNVQWSLNNTSPTSSLA